MSGARVLPTTKSPPQAGDWGLVLAAAGIPNSVDEGEGHFAIVVAVEEAGKAAEALAAFDAEGAPEVPPPAPDRGRSLLGLQAAIGFALMFLVTGPRAGGSRWF